MYKYTWQDILKDFAVYLLVMAILTTAITVVMPLFPDDQQQELPRLTNSTQCNESYELRSATIDGFTIYYRKPTLCGICFDLQPNESEQIQSIDESLNRLFIDTVTTPTVNGISIFMKQ